MGRPKTFTIDLINNPTGVYLGGQMVEGSITLELDEPMSIRAIRVEYRGQANVRWTEQRSTGKTTYTVVYWSSEKYFDAQQDLWTKQKDGSPGSDEMAKGLYTFPFNFQLPEGIPSSFEETTGKVRYWVKAVIDRRFRFNHDTKKAFTVLQHLDLNKESDAEMEVNGSKDKYLCCLCCRSGPISGTLRIPRKGYVPGEVIIIDADIYNLSRRRMVNTTVKIVQHVAYHATTKTRTEKKKVAELQHGEIPPGGSDTWRGDRLVVPALPPSYLHGCQIIDISYFLQLTVDPSGLALDLKLPVSMVIGSIPLQQALDQYRSMGFHMAALPTSDQVYSVAGPGPSSAGLTPVLPPSYSESVFGRVNIREDDDEKDNEEENTYAPVYAYYNWGFESSPSAGVSPSK